MLALAGNPKILAIVRLLISAFPDFSTPFLLMADEFISSIISSSRLNIGNSALSVVADGNAVSVYDKRSSRYSDVTTR
jgi:hypothetical protein